MDVVSKGFGIAFLVCWVVYLALFVGCLRGSMQGRESDPASVMGMLLQLAALGLLGWFRREPLLGSVVLNIVGLAATLSAIALTRSALRHLGEQWSLVGGVQRRHRLVTEGPYRRVRHPLYLGFFLMTLGTGLALGSLVGLLLALPIALCAAGIRIAVEERLLRQKFGKAYFRYCEGVPSLFPRLRPVREKEPRR